ncbi:hypothetical protein K6Y31_05000 [Motilimonas cestriensis]|uniref:Uncharacterized protein n=1 Tax=Motilimonas cestriensis TaxID=2742685 RepID=A0ABS8W8U2_9GAMM|nr:hypothetical protein [Motilimonas cestriensis]MCE2594168.1 hypothetical protein [Motilimonas cestriensis]
MTTVERINAYKAALAEKNAVSTEFFLLRDTRAPELEVRAQQARHTVNMAEQTLASTYDDAAFAQAKTALEDAKASERDAQLMLNNVNTRLKSLQGVVIPQLTAALEQAKKSMWQAKYDEVFAALPELPNDIKLAVEQLAAIKLNVDPYTTTIMDVGQAITDKFGKPEQSQIATIDVQLRVDMGIA